MRWSPFLSFTIEVKSDVTFINFIWSWGLCNLLLPLACLVPLAWSLGQNNLLTNYCIEGLVKYIIFSLGFEHCMRLKEIIWTYVITQYLDEVFELNLISLSIKLMNKYLCNKDLMPNIPFVKAWCWDEVDIFYHGGWWLLELGRT